MVSITGEDFGCRWPTASNFYVCKLFLYCMTLKSPHMIEQTRKMMAPDVAMNFLNWWTWWDRTNKEYNCTRRCYALMKEFFCLCKFKNRLNRWQIFTVFSCSSNDKQTSIYAFWIYWNVNGWVKLYVKNYPLIPIIK